ncbi:hypothetical protein D3C71_1144810 [compost metagenome]
MKDLEQGPIYREFPRFRDEPMPPIPDEWEDTSWHNDTAPSFQFGGLCIWVFEEDPTERELPHPSRFMVCRLAEDEPCIVADLLCTNDWASVLECVAREART